MKKVYTLILLFLKVYTAHAGVSSQVVTTNPNIPLIGDSVTITVDLNETLEEYLLLIPENLYLYPLNLTLNPSLGENRLSCSAEYFKMHERRNNIWEITFVPQQLFQNIANTTALKFQLKTKNYVASKRLGKISSSYFMVVFYANADSTGAVVACNGSVGINYTDSVNGTLKWYRCTNGPYYDMNRNNQRFFYYANTTDADIVRAEINNSNCNPSNWHQDKLILKGYSSSNLGLFVNSISSGLIRNDNSGLLNKKIYSFNAKHPVYNATFANNIRMYEDGMEKSKAHILFDSTTNTYESIYTIDKLYEPQHTAIIDYSEGCSDTIDLDYQRSTYNIDTSQLWIFIDTLFAVSKPIYDGRHSTATGGTNSPPQFMNFNYYNLSDNPLPDASITLNITSPDTLLRTFVMKNMLPINQGTSTLQNYPLGSPSSHSANGPYAFPFLTWNTFRNVPLTVLKPDSLYLFEAIFTLNTSPIITRKFYTEFRWNSFTGTGMNSYANLRIDSVIVLNPKSIYNQKDSLHLRIKVSNTGGIGCHLASIWTKLFNPLTNSIIPTPGYLALYSGSTNVPPTGTFTVDQDYPCSLLTNDNSNPDNLFDLMIFVRDTSIGYRWDDTVKIRLSKQSIQAKIIVTDVTFSESDTAVFNDQILRSITVYNAGQDTSYYFPSNGAPPIAALYVVNGHNGVIGLNPPHDKAVPKLYPNEYFTFYDTVSVCPDYSSADKRAVLIKDPYYLVYDAFIHTLTIDTVFIKQPMPFVDFTKPDISISPNRCKPARVELNYQGTAIMNQLGIPFTLKTYLYNLSTINVDTGTYRFTLYLVSNSGDTVYTTTQTQFNGALTGGALAYFNLSFTFPTNLFLPYLGNYTLLLKAEHPSLTESDYANNIARLSIKVANPHAPDLEVINMSALNTNHMSSIVRFEGIRVKNSGDTISNPTKVRIYLDTLGGTDFYLASGAGFTTGDGNCCGSGRYTYTKIDTFGANVWISNEFMYRDSLYTNGRFKKLVEVSIPAIASGGTHTIPSVSFDTDSLHLTQGYWTYVVAVDDDNALLEHDESNNHVNVKVKIMNGSFLQFYSVYSPINRWNHQMGAPSDCKASLLSGAPFPLYFIIANRGNSISDTAELVIRSPQICSDGCFTHTENLTCGYNVPPSPYQQAFDSYPIIKKITIPPMSPGGFTSLTMDTFKADINLPYTTFTNVMGDLTIPFQLNSKDTILHPYFPVSDGSFFMNDFNMGRSQNGISYTGNDNKRLFISFGLNLGAPKLEVINVDFDSLKTCGDTLKIRVTIKNKSNAFAQTTPFRVEGKHNFGLSQTITVNSLAANTQTIVEFKCPVKFSGLDNGLQLRKTIGLIVTLRDLTASVSSLDTASFSVVKVIPFVRKNPTLPAVTFTSTSQPTISWTTSAGASFYKKMYLSPYGNILDSGTTTITHFKATKCSQYGNYTFSVQPFNMNCEYANATNGLYNCAAPPPPPPNTAPVGGSIDNDHGNTSGGTNGNGCVKLDAGIGDWGSVHYKLKNNCLDWRKVVTTIVARDANNNSDTRVFTDYLEPGQTWSDFWMTGLSVDDIDYSCVSYTP